MPTKEEIIAELRGSKRDIFTTKEIINLVDSVKLRNEIIPTVLKKGDVVIVNYNKKRPAVVIKVLKEKEGCLVIPLSTTEDELNLCESDSRFLGPGFFSKSVVTLKYEYARTNFICCYDNIKLLNAAIQKLKDYLKII